MRFPIRPGKVTCAGVVAILMVLPNSIWKSADAPLEARKTFKVSTPHTHQRTCTDSHQQFC